MSSVQVLKSLALPARTGGPSVVESPAAAGRDHGGLEPGPGPTARHCGRRSSVRLLGDEPMPFTLAHPAAVVPLARRFPQALPLSALTMGSMAPDFEYFVYLHPVRTISHDLAGIPLLCIPSGLVLLWIFQHVMKRPLIELFPGHQRRRLSSCAAAIPFWPLGRLAGIVVALAVGAASHLVWDAATHANGWVVERCPPLTATIVALGGREFKVFDFLQHASGAVGLGLLAYWYRNWLNSPERPPRAADRAALSDRLRSAVIAALAIVPTGATLWICLRSYPDIAPQGFYDLIVRLVIGWISTFVVAAFGYGLAARLVTPEDPIGDRVPTAPVRPASALEPASRDDADLRRLGRLAPDAPPARAETTRSAVAEPNQERRRPSTRDEFAQSG
jgi:hypothetical protein